MDADAKPAKRKSNADALCSSASSSSGAASSSTVDTLVPPPDAKRQQVGSDLVLCSSGVQGDDFDRLEAACAKLGARLVSQWSDSVTHLVMTRVGWTPKFLYALAGLVPIVNPLWVQRAADRGPDEPLPDDYDPELRPLPAGSSTEGVAAVRPERARLFRGRRYIGLPGAPLDTQILLGKMGAEVHAWPWPDAPPEEGAEPSILAQDEYFSKRIAEGYAFVLPGDEKWPTADEAKAAIAAGADVISPLLVRTSLIMAKITSARHIASAGALAKSGET